jgi:hypothetical protein
MQTANTIHGAVQPSGGRFYRKVKNLLKWEKFALIAQVAVLATKNQVGNSALIAEPP